MVNLDINKGDILLGGRFKNQRMEVKTTGTDKLGQPTVNKKKLLSFRIEKTLPFDKKSSKTKEATMNKEAYLKDLYTESLNDELEKIAGKEKVVDAVTKGIKRSIWSPGGVAAERKAFTRGEFKKGIRGIDSGDKAMVKSLAEEQGKLKTLEGVAAKKLLDVEKLQGKGTLEKLFRGKLGTKSHRIKKLDKATTLAADYQRGIGAHKGKIKGIKGDIKQGAEQTKTQKEALRDTYRSEMSDTALANVGNIAARTGMIGGAGTGAYFGGKEIQKRRRLRQGYAY